MSMQRKEYDEIVKNLLENIHDDKGGSQNKSVEYPNEFQSLRQSETARIAAAMLRGETPEVKSEAVEMEKTAADRLRDVQNTYRKMMEG